MFSRWVNGPFEQTCVGEDENSGLDKKLQTDDELEGLLVQAVAGLARLIERGHFKEPGSVVRAGQAYRMRLDSVAAFVDDENVSDSPVWLFGASLISLSP